MYYREFTMHERSLSVFIFYSFLDYIYRLCMGVHLTITIRE